jgi:hypothetical protein
MIRHSVLVVAAVLASCTAVGPGGPETYQKILTMLCNAPPNIMQNVLTTPQLQQAWQFICSHTGSVPALPVTQTIAGADQR